MYLYENRYIPFNTNDSRAFYGGIAIFVGSVDEIGRKQANEPDKIHACVGIAPCFYRMQR